MDPAAPPDRPLLEELHLHRVLVAVDGSPSAELALSLALTAAQRDHAAVTLITVVVDMVADSSRLVIGAADPLVLQDEADAEGQRVLRETVERIPRDIPVTTVLRRGRPGPEIVAQARERDYDAILLGARGRGRVGSLIGSVSGYVLHHADTAVFVAHPPRGASR